ncbi:MAG TPA: hypothetical protein VF792_11340 [Ktedonobacterales bacterium]
MFIVRIEHPVPNFEGWKQAFENDPVDRKGAGVLRYHIMRATDDPLYVLIDLEFEDLPQAERMLAALRQLWGRVEGSVMSNAKARIVEVVETKNM